MRKCNFVFRGMGLSTFSHDAVRILASPESITGGAPNCKAGEFLVSNCQWLWFSMLTRNFISSGQNSAHPLLDDRWIVRSAITRDSCVFNTREYRILRNASVRKRNLRA